jgi:hypothetical protein
MRWAGHVAPMGEMKYACKILVVKPEGKVPLGRRGRRCEGNIRTDPRKIQCEVVGWIHLAQNREQRRAFVNVVMNIWVP